MWNKEGDTAKQISVVLPLHRWKANYCLLMVTWRQAGLENTVLPPSVAQSSRGSPSSTDTPTALITTERSPSFTYEHLRNTANKSTWDSVFHLSSWKIRLLIIVSDFIPLLLLLFTVALATFFWECHCASYCQRAPKSLEISSQCLEIQEMLNWSGWLPESWMVKPQI